MTRRAHPFAPKLQLEDAVAIRARFADGVPATELASEYGVSRSSLYGVLRGDTHPCAVTITLRDADFVGLAEAAARVGRPLPAFIAEMLARIWRSSTA